MRKLLTACVSALLLCTLFGACKEKDMSIKLNNPHNIRGVISYKRSFNDLNDVQLATAKRIGIRPISSREAAEVVLRKSRRANAIRLILLHIPSLS